MRRTACAALLLLMGAGLAAGAAPGDAPVSPHAALGPVGLADARWASGFWAERFTTCRKETLPALGRIMAGTERSQFLHNFRIAAGLEKGRHRGAPFNDGEVYKWLEAAAAVYALTKDRELGRQMDEALRVIALAQRADGYLHTPVLIKNRNGDATARPLARPLDFEMYNLGHLFTAACVHRRATGKSDLLNVAVKAADFLQGAFKNPTPELARHAVCPSHYMGLVELSRTKRDAKYLRLAEKLVALRDRVEGGSDDNQDRVPFRKQTQAVGHAVRANYLYAGVADLYAETGDKTLLGPLLAVWEDIVSRKMYVTGGCGALYDGASPDGAKEQKQIARVHQAYGRAYQLPNSTAHNETCAAVACVRWNWRMLQVTGEARFADVLERVLYNAALAGVSLDGRRFFYTNTLRQLDQMPAELRWPRERQPYLSSFCCPPNLARTVALAHTYAYGRSDGAIWVHLFGGSVLDTTLPPHPTLSPRGGEGRVRGERVALVQETDYPWDGRVRIRVRAAPARAVTLRLRVPGWADGASLSVNGTAVREATKPGRYAAVARTWAVGDVVELNLPLRPRLLQAHPLVEEARNQVAVQRGPLVYCLESADLERGVRVSDVILPRRVDLRPRHDRALLGGVTVLEGKAEAVVERPWSGQLYRELAPAAPRTIPLRLVPYYAWGNRGRSEMTVWLPLGRP